MNTLSVLIATKNRPNELQACLRSILAQSPKPIEVVVVDQSLRSQEATISELFRPSQVHLHYVHAPGLSGLTQARNRAVQLSSGTLLLFLDDDVELGPGYVREILAVFDADRVGQIGGAGGLIDNFLQTLSSGQCLRSWMFYRGPFCLERDPIRFHLYPGDSPRPALRLHGCNMTFRRSVMDKLQFDETYFGYSFGEDRDFSALVARSFKLFWVPRARLVHKQAAKNRLAREQFCELRLLSWLRFYEQCAPKTLASLLSYAWLNVGFLTLLLAFWDPATVQGTYRGFRHLVAIAARRSTLSEVLQATYRPGI